MRENQNMTIKLAGVIDFGGVNHLKIRPLIDAIKKIAHIVSDLTQSVSQVTSDEHHR